MKKDTDAGIKLKLGKKKYVIYYTFIPAKREGDEFPPKSVDPPRIEVNAIMRRRRSLGEDEIRELWTQYEEFIRAEALKAEWNKRVKEIERLLALKT